MTGWTYDAAKWFSEIVQRSTSIIAGILKAIQADMLAKKFIQLAWNTHKDSTASTTFLSGSVDFSASEIRSHRVFRPSISSLRYAYEDKNKINGLSKYINY